MDNNDVRVLVEAFKGYRDLLEPIQLGLADFLETYQTMEANIEKLGEAFGGEVSDSLKKIYDNLSGQAQSATNLSSRIEQFVKTTDRYTTQVATLLGTIERVEERLGAVNEIESKAERQLGKLDEILEEKKKSYNVRDLQRTLENYDANVQKVSEFINREVAETMSENARKLDSIRSGNENLAKRLDEENSTVEKLLAAYSESSAFLRRIAEREDVNEQYLFELLDKWAEARGVRAKKK